jgi:hypothetical protein
MADKDLGENAGVIDSLITLAPAALRKTVITAMKYSVYYTYYGSLFRLLWISGVSADYNNFLVSVLPDRRKITITGKDFVTSYIPPTSAATLKLQADPDFILDDEDNLWFTGGVQNNVAITNLIGGNEYTRTLIKYANDTPENIYMIGLIRSGITLTSAQIEDLARDFWLWLFWSSIKT